MYSRLGFRAAVNLCAVTFVCVSSVFAAGGLSVKSVERIPGTRSPGLIFFPGTNFVFTQQSAGSYGNFTTVVRQDQSSFTIVTEGWANQFIADGDKIYALCSMAGTPTYTSVIKEYDLNTGKFIADVAEGKKVDAIYVYRGNLYLIRKGFAASGGGGGSAISIQTVSLAGTGEETSRTIDTSVFTGTLGSFALKIRGLEDALYWWVFPQVGSSSCIIKTDLQGGFVDLYEIPSPLDICVIPQRSSLGFVSATNRRKGQYIAGFLSLDGAIARLTTADFSLEGVHIGDYLDYDPVLHAFVIRGEDRSPSSVPEFFRLRLSEPE